MKKYLGVLAVVLLSCGVLLAADAKGGEAAYLKACKNCHQVDGAPVAKVASMMKVEMKDLSSKDVQAKSDADLKKIITDGQRKMKPVKTVSAKEADDIVAFIRTLKK